MEQLDYEDVLNRIGEFLEAQTQEKEEIATDNKNIYFNNVLNDETVRELLLEIDTALESFESITLYFSTEGGTLGSARVLTDALSKRKNEVELVGFESLFSAGLLVYNDTLCSKRLLPDTIAMAHLPDRTFSSRDVVNHSTLDRQLQKYNDEVFMESFLVYYKNLGLTKTELKRIRKGEDVLLTPERLRVLFTT